MKTHELENKEKIKNYTYQELSEAFRESRRLFLLGFKHYLKSVYLINEELKSRESQMVRRYDSRKGNYEATSK